MRRTRRRLRKAYFQNYKLEPHEVVHIYHLVNVADLPRLEIAEHFDISQSHVSNIGKKRFWKELLERIRV